jgi:hypothetical protein
MKSDVLAVVTPTVGDSAGRLEHLCAELRRFTSLPFRQVISDDGTLDEGLVQRQVAIASRHCALWTQNPGPVWGVSYNLNWAFRYVDTPWVYLVEDGLRPSWGWLEAAVEFIDRVGSVTWGGRKVGMAGFASLQDWQLVMGGAYPGDVMDVYRGDTSGFYGPYNDGLWCWKRLLPGLYDAVKNQATRYDGDVEVFRQVMVGGFGATAAMHPTDREQSWQKWRINDHWPARRSAWCGWYPGAFMLVNVDAWRDVGGWRDGCTFFEGHLGVRMGQKGYLSLCVEGPPWLHCPSQGFRDTQLAASPRIHRDTRELFLADFGYDNMDAPNVVATGVVSLEEQRKINIALAETKLSFLGNWERYLHE